MKTMQKIKTFNTELRVYDDVKVHYCIDFGVALEEIPNWNIIKDVPAIQKFLQKGNFFYIEDGYVKFFVKGYATKMDNDEWDEDKGKHIAITKAQRLMHTRLADFYSDLITIVFSEVSSPLIQNMIKHSNSEQECCRHLKEDIYNKRDNEYVGDKYVKDYCL